MVDGVRVVKDEALLSPLSARSGRPITFPTIRVLTLANGSTRHACADAGCPDVVGSRGDVKRHRISHHGEGSARRKAAGGGPAALSEDALSMRLGELIRLAATVDGWEDAHAALEQDRDQWKERALAAERQVLAFERALARLGFKVADED